MGRKKKGRESTLKEVDNAFARDLKRVEKSIEGDIKKIEKDIERATKPPKGWRSAWGNFGGIYKKVDQKEKRKKRRTSIPITTVKKLLLRSKGKCEKCKTLIGGRLIPDFHHKNEDPSDHKMSNIAVLCPNCHRKETDRLKEKKEGKKSQKRSRKR